MENDFPSILWKKSTGERLPTVKIVMMENKEDDSGLLEDNINSNIKEADQMAYNNGEDAENSDNLVKKKTGETES